MKEISPELVAGGWENKIIDINRIGRPCLKKYKNAYQIWEKISDINNINKYIYI